jgi:hypothetical protein
MLNYRGEKMKVRLIMRKGIADADGKCVGYDYTTEIVDVNLENESPLCRPEIIGGEWCDKEVKDGR